MYKPPKVAITQQRSVHTYSEIWHASKCVLTNGMENPAGSTWQYLSSIVLTAFAFEAYLNHVGPVTLGKEAWEAVERHPVYEKFLLLAEELGAEFSDGPSKRPVQTVKLLFKFRNSIAHGRSERLRQDETKSHRQNMDFFASPPKTDWEKKIMDSKFAQRAREDVEAVLQALHALRKDDKEGLFSFGAGHGSATIQMPGVVTFPLDQDED